MQGGDGDIIFGKAAKMALIFVYFHDKKGKNGR